MYALLPRHNEPGTLTEPELRALWLLRTSLLPLKPSVDPEQDYRDFREFVFNAWVESTFEPDGRACGMICHQRIDGWFAGRPYRIALFEYGFVEPGLRKHPKVAFQMGRAFIGCRRLRPGVANYFAGVGYPRSALLLARAVPEVRIDGDPRLDALERHVIARVAERMGSKYDRERGVVELPTIPEPIRPDWRAKLGDSPLLRAYEAKVPDWEQGRAAIMIGRLDGSGRLLARELARRATLVARNR